MMFKRVASYIGFFCVLYTAFTPQWLLAENAFDFGAQGFYTIDDNISRAQFDSDIEEDQFYTVSAHAAYTLGFGMSSSLSFAGIVTNEEFLDFDGLSNTRVQGNIKFVFQPGNGFTATRWSVFLNATNIDAETDIRDSVLTEFGFTATKRFTTRITATFGVTASERKADGGVFDLERTRYFGNIDWRLGSRWAMYLTYNSIDGDVVSTARPTVAIISWADAIEADNAFGGLANNKFAYRLDADTAIIRLGVNIALNHSSSIDVSYDDLGTQAAGPIEYDVGSFTLGYLYHF